jgi:hypothetical protein
VPVGAAAAAATASPWSLRPVAASAACSAERGAISNIFFSSKIQDNEIGRKTRSIGENMKKIIVDVLTPKPGRTFLNFHHLTDLGAGALHLGSVDHVSPMKVGI